MQYADRGTLSDAVEQGLLRGGMASCESNTVHLNSGGRGAGNDDEPDLAALLATASEVASAMTYLHSLDILHGDLTGSNILLCSSTRPTDSRGFVAKVRSAQWGTPRHARSNAVMHAVVIICLCRQIQLPSPQMRPQSHRQIATTVYAGPFCAGWQLAALSVTQQPPRGGACAVLMAYTGSPVLCCFYCRSRTSG